MTTPPPDRSQVLKQALTELRELRARLASAEQRGREPIAIVGIGCRFPGGASSPAAYWALLRDGVDATSEVPPDRWDQAAYHDPDPAAPGKIYTRRGGFLDAVDGFDARFFSVSAREARSVDPQHRLLLEVAWEALEDAAIAPDRLARSRTGVYVGISASDYAHLLLNGPITDLDGYVGLGTAFNFAPGRLSYLLGLQGPSLALDSACSSSLVAVHLACQSLRAGETDLALAGGVSLVLSPEVQVILCRARVLAPDGRCKTFDAAADGYGRGEGCGVVALKRLADAQRDGDRIHAVIRGTAVNQDGPASGLTVPSAAAQQAVVRAACLAAGVAPQHIDYVEAHGTGTPLGDPIEIRALAAALGQGRPADRPLLVGSAKTNLGHLEAAAGVAGLIKAALALAHAEIPPHLHLSTPNPAIDWDHLPVRVPTVRTPWPAAATRPLAGVSSFGASGTNAHVVLEAPPPPPDHVPSPRSHELFTLSARSEAALRALADRHERHLAADPDASLADLCATVNTGRATLPHRLAIVASSRDVLRDALEATARGDTHPAATTHHAGEPPRVAFLFTGQGAQYVAMGRALYTTQPVFRDALDACDTLLRPHLPRPLLAVLHGDDPDALAETVYTQPALFAVEWALAALWRSWGVEPAAVLGHSLGEYVAAAVAGVLSLADALRLVATRATAMQALPPGGAMEAVFADEATVAAAVQRAGDGQVTIAAVNGPAEVVISGPAGAVAAVADLLAARGHGRRRLNVAHAFHSPLIEPALAALEHAAGEVQLAAPRIALVSNLTGRLARDELTRPAYYREHARAPVRFHDGLLTLHAQGIELFLEIGPAPVLSGMGRRCLPDGAALFLASLRQNHDPWATLLTSLGALFVRGVRVDWPGLHRGETRRKLALPTYPFERTRCWTDLAPAAHRTTTTTTTTTQPGLALRRLISPALGERRIVEATLAADTLPALRDHRVYDRLVVSGVIHLQLVAAALTDDPAAPPPLEFTAVSFAQPLLLPEPGARLVQAIVSPVDDDGTRRFELTSADASAPTRWTVHTTGRVRPLGPADLRPPARSLDLIRARCPEQRAGDDFYAKLWRPDEHHLGPSFRSIDHIWRRDGEALARLVLPPAELLAPDGSPADLAFARNACIGEVFGQALMPAVPDYERLARDAHTTFIGHGVAASRDHEGAVLRARWCHAVLRESAPDHLVGDIALLDDTGVVISVVLGLRVQRVDRALVRQAFERMLRRADRPTVDPAALLAGDDTHARARLATYLAARVAAVAGVASTTVQAADSLRDLGLDSLLATELAAVVREDLGVAPELAAMVAGASLTSLADGLLTTLRHAHPAPAPAHDTPPARPHDLAAHDLATPAHDLAPRAHDLATPRAHDLATPAHDLATPRAAPHSPSPPDDRWLRNLAPTAPGAPRMRVFCVPHGGAGAAAFGPWRGTLPDLELCAVQLPGRGDRWTEPPHTRIDPLVEAIADAISPRLDLPFALFGASLGALLSFELAHVLRRRGLPAPSLLITAACPAPHIPALLGRRDEIVHALAARDDLAALHLGRLGILPDALVREPEVVRMSLPALRADFGIVLGYTHRPAPPLDVPIVALGGSDDPDVAAEALAGWARYTTAPFRLHMLPGGHLFYREQPEARAELLRACRQALTRE